jgi:hypothetical protein
MMRRFLLIRSFVIYLHGSSLLSLCPEAKPDDLPVIVVL